MAHFYLVETGLPEQGGLARIEGAEARHAATVSRVRAGERLLVGDGSGTVVEGPVEDASASLVTVRAETVTRHPEPKVRTTLVQALAKGDRDELGVQAATELGVARVIPWQAERSVSRWDGAKAVKGVDRWRAIVREASKQSLRPRLPEVTDLVGSRALPEVLRDSLVLVLDPRAEVGLPAAARSRISCGATDVALVVGPEGGVTPAELERLVDAGAVAVRLGAEVLRTSTAGPAALAALNALLGVWD